jgi:PST family polysaccharide transporter
MSVWVTVRRAAGASVARFLAPTAPAALAAIAAGLVPLATDRLGVPELHPVLAVLVVGTSAGLVAAATLWSTDRPLRRRVLQRLRRRPAASRPARVPV